MVCSEWYSRTKESSLIGCQLKTVTQKPRQRTLAGKITTVQKMLAETNLGKGKITLDTLPIKAFLVFK